MKVHTLLARGLKDQGVATLFGLMGDANMQFIASYVDDANGQFIGSVHESGALGMADGFARATGSVGVAAVTHGPGTTNAVTALVEAVRAGTQLVVLTADTPAGKRHHAQWIDLQAVIAPTGAGYRAVRQAEDVVDELGRALAQAAAEHRPVVLNIPVDFLDADVPETPTKFGPTTSQAIAPDASLIDSALGVIASARRPLVIAGRGAVLGDARKAIEAFADLIGAAVSTTVPARGFFAGHSLNLGICGNLAHPVALDAIMNSDCVIAFGAGLNDHTTELGAILEGKGVVQIDRDAHRLERYHKVDVAIQADAGLAATMMTELLESAGIDFAPGRAGLAERLAARDPKDEFEDATGADTVDMRTAMLRLNARLPQQRAVVTDAGRFLSSVWRHLEVPDPRLSFVTQNFGSIGLGLGCALGVAAATPERVTFAVLGDGGAMMTINEFSTAVRNKLPLVALVLNDGSYGAEYSKLQGFGADPRHSLMVWPEFCEVAVALGANAIVIRSLEEIDSLDPSIWEPENLPLLIEVKVDPTVDYYG